MSRARSAVAALVVGAALALLTAVILGLPSPSPAQKDAATPSEAPPSEKNGAAKNQGAPAELPSGYVGAEACKACHPAQYEKFARTRMGRLFLHQARNTTEGL